MNCEIFCLTFSRITFSVQRDTQISSREWPIFSFGTWYIAVLVLVFFHSSKVVVTISDLASSLNKIQTLKNSQFVCVLTSRISQVPRKFHKNQKPTLTFFHKTNSYYFLSFSGLHSASALWSTLGLSVGNPAGHTHECSVTLSVHCDCLRVSRKIRL